MKIVDILSSDEIPINLVELWCTNPSVSCDLLYFDLQLINHEATQITSLSSALSTGYQIFALFDVSKKKGEVWHPIKVIER